MAFPPHNTIPSFPACKATRCIRRTLAFKKKKKRRRVLQPPIWGMWPIRRKVMKEANGRKQKETETRETDNGSTWDTHADKLSQTLSWRHKVQLLLNSDRWRRNCQNAVLLLAGDGLVYLGRKPEKSLSLVSERNRDKMALSDWEFLDALLRVTSSESLVSLSALGVSKFYFIHR